VIDTKDNRSIFKVLSDICKSSLEKEKKTHLKQKIQVAFKIKCISSIPIYFEFRITVIRKYSDKVTHTIIFSRNIVSRLSLQRGLMLISC